MNTVENGIASNSAWYVNSQFIEQLGNPSARHAIESRWRIWAEFLDGWLNDQDQDRVGPSRVLDAGCGDGINLVWLASEFTRRNIPIELSGVDYNRLRLARAQDNLPDANILGADLRQIPFGAGSFDVILCNHVVEHIADDAMVLNELSRILSPGGLLILGVPNEGCLLARIRNHLLQRNILQTTDHVHFYTKQKISRLVEKASLDPYDVRVSGFFVPHLRLSRIVGQSSYGRKMIHLLGSVFTSQASDLLLACRRA